MPIKPLLIALLAAFAATTSGAAAPASSNCGSASSANAKCAGTPPVPLLWKVSDADNDLYLLGSFHLLKPDDYPLSRDVDVAFDDAEALAFELSPQEMTSPKLGMAMAQAALRTDGKPLDSELPEALTRKLHDWSDTNSKPLEAMNIRPAMLQMFEPWFVGLMVSIVEMKKQGLDEELGLDKYFMQRADKAGKPATGLELGSEQIALFDTMSPAEQLQFLEESLGEAENARTEIESLHGAWRSGDDVALLKDMADDMRRQYPKLYQRVNVARNDAWVPKLQRMLDDEREKDTLVVVGAMHLLGSDGVVEKLRARGYRVQRVCAACGPSVQDAGKPKRTRR